jgi:Spy/CpxP family protein refolding chaperone
MVTSVLAALLLLGIPAAGLAENQPRSRHKWWQDDAVKAELGLSEKQSSDVEAVFQASLPRMREFKRRLEALEDELSRTIRERTADEAAVAALIDRVEAARSELSKERTLMLYRMHRLLTPEQNAKLKAMSERRKRERERDSGGRQP